MAASSELLRAVQLVVSSVSWMAVCLAAHLAVYLAVQLAVELAVWMV